MEAVDILKDQRDQNHGQNQYHSPSTPLRVLQYDVKNDVADITAAVEDFLEQFVKIFEDHHAQGTVISSIEPLQSFHHQLVGFALNVLQVIILLLDLLEIDSGPQLFDEKHHSIGSFL